MYHRYSQVNAPSMPVSQQRRNLVKNILILALLIAVAVLAVIAYPAVQSRTATRNLYIQRMQNEIATAVRLTTSLSRNAGASSAAILAQIRSNIYAIITINEMSIALEGANGRLVPEEQLTSLQSSIDNYLTFLTTGMDTGEYQTNLQNTLEALQVQINLLGT